ncbi:hypothetical protein [Erythrobacter sp.]|uniref:hypothetical protein n=1 Tax=Erythrobacter sp. TaxID=1042 RepID=UPI001425EDD4|nr:hypothetical protein [Erythrobacter sp.]QIQ85741.1 MAG: hypothetical protein G9473_02855 [Erythrobacter sp.]
MSISLEASHCSTTAQADPRDAVAGPEGKVVAFADARVGEDLDEGTTGFADLYVVEPDGLPITGLRNALLPALALWGAIAASVMLVWRVLG